jgi:hypothetical protein
MAKYRAVKTKFWDDPFIVTLDCTEKYLFLYLITNQLTNIAGIYEIPLRRIEYDTNLEEKQIKLIMQKFAESDKIFYIHNYIIIRNFMKNQKMNPKVMKGIEIILEDLPLELQDIIIKNDERIYIDYDSLSKAMKNLNIKLNNKIQKYTMLTLIKNEKTNKINQRDNY